MHVAPLHLRRHDRSAKCRPNPLFWVGALITATMILAGVLAPVIAPYGPTEEFRDLMPLSGDALGPTEQFPLGTDRVGRNEWRIDEHQQHGLDVLGVDRIQPRHQRRELPGFEGVVDNDVRGQA